MIHPFFLLAGSLIVNIGSFGQGNAQDMLALLEQSETTAQTISEVMEKVGTMEDGFISGVISEEKISYKGSVKRSKLHGSWESRFPNQSPFEKGAFIKGIPDGTWEIWYPKGTLRYVRTFSSEKWEYMGQLFLRAHPKFKHPPLSEMYQKNPALAKEFLLQNVSFPNYSKFPDYNPFYKEGLLHGSYINYNEDGIAIDSGQYAYGLRAGIWRETVRNSELAWVGKYTNGYREGNWKCMNASNKIVSLVSYQRGKVIWRKDYP